MLGEVLKVPDRQRHLPGTVGRSMPRKAPSPVANTGVITCGLARVPDAVGNRGRSAFLDTAAVDPQQFKRDLVAAQPEVLLKLGGFALGCRCSRAAAKIVAHAGPLGEPLKLARFRESTYGCELASSPSAVTAARNLVSRSANSVCNVVDFRCVPHRSDRPSPSNAAISFKARPLRRPHSARSF